MVLRLVFGKFTYIFTQYLRHYTESEKIVPIKPLPKIQAAVSEGNTMFITMALVTRSLDGIYKTFFTRILTVSYDRVFNKHFIVIFQHGFVQICKISTRSIRNDLHKASRNNRLKLIELCSIENSLVWISSCPNVRSLVPGLLSGENNLELSYSWNGYS